MGNKTLKEITLAWLSKEQKKQNYICFNNLNSVTLDGSFDLQDLINEIRLVTKEDLNIKIRKKLNKFISKRQKEFPTITKKQKEKWAEMMKEAMTEVLGDSDIFYDNIPDEIE